jgi:hypothetical protein
MLKNPSSGAAPLLGVCALSKSRPHCLSFASALPGLTSHVLEGVWRFKAVRRNLAYATELRQRVLLLAFLAIHGNPYDVTSYQSQHPC